MSFYFANPRAFFPLSAGPTVVYSAPYQSNPWGYSSCGPHGCGVASRAFSLPQKRPLVDLLEEALPQNLFASLHGFPQTKFARLFGDFESDSDSDEMDYEDDCGCDNSECGEGGCGAACDDSNAEAESESLSPSEASDPKSADSDTPNIQKESHDSEKAVTKAPEGGNSLFDFMSFFSNDALNFKVDESDEAVTVSSTWIGFDKSNLKVDFKNGKLVVSGKAEVEEKDERTGAVSHSSKSVSRTIALPENIDKHGIRAKFNDETSSLTIVVPKVKKEEKERETIVIN